MELLTKLFKRSAYRLRKDRAVNKDNQEEEKEVINVQKEEDKNTLELFLLKDFQQLGNRDGYENQSAIFMKENIILLKSKFDFELTKKIEEIKCQVLGLRKFLSRSKDVSDLVSEETKLTIEHVEDKLLELMAEKELAQEGFGLISKVIAEYTIGYRVGVKNYGEEYALMITGRLFTQPIKHNLND